ncbi:hypothetical protein [Streptomyces paludis]|uniref:Uncharacterized protein n=1 Tax=Streptomyces paludis TaxID=2282738 RepID=A0A345HW17_9ACTN|nr:hypothetical protein [Streptomyces paludis]AXG80891.1 hypothetical protein DVK44_28110 [Streptomyces paludis]
MDEDRAGRLVAALRARGVPAHLAHLGVYRCGVQIVLPGGGEAVWDYDPGMGLRAEVVEDGVLVGFVPQVSGSADFTEERLVAVIAATRYDREALSTPVDSGTEPDGTGGDGTGLPYRDTGPAFLSRARRRRLRLPRWPRRPW